MMHFSWGGAIFLLAGLSILLPLGTRLAGRADLARRLDVIPRIVFGLLCLGLASSRHSLFSYIDEGTGAEAGAAPALLSRVLFGAVGLFLTSTAVRRLVTRNFPDDSLGPPS